MILKKGLGVLVPVLLVHGILAASVGVIVEKTDGHLLESAEFPVDFTNPDSWVAVGIFGKVLALPVEVLKNADGTDFGGSEAAGSDSVRTDSKSATNGGVDGSGSVVASSAVAAGIDSAEPAITTGQGLIIDRMYKTIEGATSDCGDVGLHHFDENELLEFESYFGKMVGMLKLKAEQIKAA